MHTCKVQKVRRVATLGIRNLWRKLLVSETETVKRCWCKLFLQNENEKFVKTDNTTFVCTFAYLFVHFRISTESKSMVSVSAIATFWGGGGWLRYV